MKYLIPQNINYSTFKQQRFIKNINKLNYLLRRLKPNIVTIKEDKYRFYKFYSYYISFHSKNKVFENIIDIRHISDWKFFFKELLIPHIKEEYALLELKKKR